MNFSSLQREVKVLLKSNNPGKEKQKETEDSRIDFELTWNSDSPTSELIVTEPPVQMKNTRKKAKIPTAITSTSVQKEDPLSVENIIQRNTTSNTMLLEVKSVTLAMKLPGQEQVHYLLSN